MRDSLKTIKQCYDSGQMDKVIDIALIVLIFGILTFLLWFAYHLGEQHRAVTIDDLLSQIPALELVFA